MGFSKNNLVSLIKVAVENNASDIHIRTEESPSLRIHGDLYPIQSKVFSQEDLSSIAQIIMPPEQIDNLSNLKELDGGFSIDGLCRIRFNIFRYNQKLGIILRVIKEDVPSIDTLGLPKVLKDIVKQQRGLILVTGPTGSGKTTTLAAMIDYLNRKRNCHIITIEDPIEYLHTQKKARISQREVGIDTDSFNDALRGALRQDPDVILIGEMRDALTIQTALKAAETGHTVLSTVHTTDAISTIGRVISMFPPDEQEEVTKRLAINLYATISQRMLKMATKKDIAIAQEIMVTNPGIRECIRGEYPLERIRDIITENFGSGGNGSQSFDQHVMFLYKNKIITKEEALKSVSSESDFIQKIEFE